MRRPEDETLEDMMRLAALELAVTLHATVMPIRGARDSVIVATAQAFEAFLKGPDQPTS